MYTKLTLVRLNKRWEHHSRCLCVEVTEKYEGDFPGQEICFLVGGHQKNKTKTAPNNTVQTFDWCTISKQIMQNRDF